MKTNVVMSLMLVLAFAGVSGAAIVVDMSFDSLGYDTDGLTADGQLAPDASGNGYHGFLGGGSGAAIINTPDGLGIDTAASNVYVIARPGRTYTGHGDPTVSDPVTAANPFFQLQADKSYTFEALLKWDSASTDAVHGIMGQTGGSQFWMRENNGALQYAFGVEGTEASANNFTSDVDISALEADGQWHHLALVLDRAADEIRVYADYSLIYTDTQAGIALLGEMLTGTTDFRFGAYNTSSSYRFDGGQGGYVISDTALDANSFALPVPEPATMMLLGLGGLIGLRRRK